MKKPRRREIIRGFITFFWTRVPNGYGGSPRVRAKNVVRGDRFHREEVNSRYCGMAATHAKEAPAPKHRGSYPNAGSTRTSRIELAPNAPCECGTVATANRKKGAGRSRRYRHLLTPATSLFYQSDQTPGQDIAASVHPPQIHCRCS